MQQINSGNFAEGSIGRTGILAMRPLGHMMRKDL